MAKVFLSLGSNIGNRINNLHIALANIGKIIGNIIISSKVYVTEPWGYQSKNFFLNQVISVESNLKPGQVLNEIIEIEKMMGRIRSEEKYTDRIIDIDLLFYDDLIISKDELIIPHPHLHKRKFILKPLSDIAGNYEHPVLKKSIYQLLEECDDQCKVELYQD